MRAAFGALLTAIGFVIIAILVLMLLPKALYSVGRDMFYEWRAGKKPRIWGFN